MSIERNEMWWISQLTCGRLLAFIFDLAKVISTYRLCHIYGRLCAGSQPGRRAQRNFLRDYCFFYEPAKAGESASGNNQQHAGWTIAIWSDRGVAGGRQQQGGWGPSSRSSISFTFNPSAGGKIAAAIVSVSDDDSSFSPSPPCIWTLTTTTATAWHPRCAHGPECWLMGRCLPPGWETTPETITAGKLGFRLATQIPSAHRHSTVL